MTNDGSDNVKLTGDRLQLMEKKFGDLLSWRAPQLAKTVGPFSPTAFDSYDKQRLKLITACVDQLDALTDDQVNEIIRGLKGREEDPFGWQNFLHEDIYYLKSRPPKWYLGGFGHPDHVADFDYWAKMPQFSIPELTCLSIGINPKDFGEKELVKLKADKERFSIWDSLEFLLQRYEQLRRAFGWHEARPQSFMQWAQQFEFEVHPEFAERLKRYHAAPKPTVTTVAPQKRDQREVDKIAQLFTAMTIEYLGYVPGKSRTPIPKEIAELISEMGISITEETIRKYLKIGANFIPSEWKPKQR